MTWSSAMLHSDNAIIIPLHNPNRPWWRAYENLGYVGGQDTARYFYLNTETNEHQYSYVGGGKFASATWLDYSNSFFLGGNSITVGTEHRKLFIMKFTINGSSVSSDYFHFLNFPIDGATTSLNGEYNFNDIKTLPYIDHLHVDDW